MGILVHKYGGTSVASTDKIKNIAKKIVAEKEKGHDLVVVVSAMGKTTDDLIELSKKISTNPDKRDLDMLLSTGEQVSISLLSMALKEYGVDAICLTGFQAGIKTQGPHTKNKIIDIDIEKVKSYLKEGKVVVVAGFQGMNEKGDITTLGRGGSDTTAVALAAKLRGGCHIYTDVDGIYSVDPRLYKEAKKLDDISYEEMMEMASLGAGIMEPRAVEIGCKYQIPIYVASSQHDITGTTIRGVDHNMEENVITGLSISDDVLMVTISNLEFKVENIAIVFEKLAEANINVDMISQTGPINGIVNLSFTASTDDYDVIKEVMQQLKKQYQEIDIELEDDITKVSVIGVGMLNQSGVTEKIFRILANHHISFRQVTTSEISISYTINKKDKATTVAVLAGELGL
ncbi:MULTISPECIES: aspartate kinase [Turicibacter]|jgi:aspartate kinase|uniref:Aspartokinase n=3 Tax=Turicibacter sanguinis TaxID=154288 RepID=A0A9X4XAR6_9FIRM|nr:MULTISPECIES: aspartate kinase [Turicibacter]EFF63659.1 putative aspartate kinase, monofunctional class [Turicibacter sanguinis PC909]MBP3905264.1 aspartate kinase [Turicibacter sp.]MCU7189889.1 aspartate kinase [Turicibacter sanguinis]MCU7211381.1 aspartate kinase [Turicibacter sanguinis]MDB8437874.1 aspartate kinase [Turicibacter sanguinis]